MAGISPSPPSPGVHDAAISFWCPARKQTPLGRRTSVAMTTCCSEPLVVHAEGYVRVPHPVTSATTGLQLQHQRWCVASPPLRKVANMCHRTQRPSAPMHCWAVKLWCAFDDLPWTPHNREKPTARLATLPITCTFNQKTSSGCLFVNPILRLRIISTDAPRSACDASPPPPPHPQSLNGMPVKLRLPPSHSGRHKSHS